MQMLLMQIKLTHYQDAIGTLTALVEHGDGKDKLRLTLGELYLQTKRKCEAYLQEINGGQDARQ